MNVLITAGLGGVILAIIGFAAIAWERHQRDQNIDLGQVSMPRKRA